MSHVGDLNVHIATTAITFEQYEVFCTSTAVYRPEIAEPYLVLGLNGEVGELLDVVLFYKGDVPNLMLELGDSQWYAARLCTGYRLDFAKMCQAADEWRRDARYPSQTCKEAAALMSCYAGRLADKVKKRLRDGETWGAVQTQQFLDDVRNLLIWFIASSMDFVDCVNETHKTKYTYHRVLTMNRDKLMSRKERGTLHGTGDHR